MDNVIGFDSMIGVQQPSPEEQLRRAHQLADARRAGRQRSSRMICFLVRSLARLPEAQCKSSVTLTMMYFIYL